MDLLHMDTLHWLSLLCALFCVFYGIEAVLRAIWKILYVRWLDKNGLPHFGEDIDAPF